MSIRSLASAAFPAQSFEVAPEIKGMKKELKARDSSFVRWVLSISLSMFFIAGVWLTPIYLVNALETSSVIELAKGIIGAVAVVGVTLYSLRLIDSTDSDANEERRATQRNLRKVTKSARALGNVPVLTKDHAEYGLRLDDAMAAQSPAWKQTDAEAVRSMLLADLSRGITILSLIEDRGLTTAAEVIQALNEMESNGKPLQNGWL